MPVYLTVEFDHTTTLPVHPGTIKNLASVLLKLCGYPDGELSILLVSDQRIRALNKEYRKKDAPTNVLAFPQLEDFARVTGKGALLGDIVISLDTAGMEAQREGISVHHRVTVLLIHGLLHLLGFDHERSVKEALRMESEEEKVLELLNSEIRREKMINLAVNVDHVATLRQARGINEPDPVHAAVLCELAGAGGIVVHLREDRRHIQDRDVILLRQTVKTKLNLEMAASEEIIKGALKLKPDMITLVPEKRQELTTEGGLNVSGQKKKLAKVVARMAQASIPVSIFIDPNAKQIKAAKDIDATFVEIHTGRYCDAASDKERDEEFLLIAEAAETAFEAGLRVNAGHGLNYTTTQRIAALEHIEELSIGHAILS